MDQGKVEQLIKECEYDPNEIGVTLLKALGYKVDEFSNWEGYSVFVYDKDDHEKLIYWR